MNIADIEAAIVELESGDTTYSNCAKLADLYTVKEHLSGTDVGEDTVVEEYIDILPSYGKYKEVKTKYNNNEVTEDAVIETAKDMSQEIKEFIQTLYSNLDTEAEKQILVRTIAEIKTLY